MQSRHCPASSRIRRRAIVSDTRIIAMGRSDAKLRMRYLITVSFIRLVDIINTSWLLTELGEYVVWRGGEIVAVIRNALLGTARFAPGRSGFFD